jgi:glutaredoxin-like protein
MQLTPENITWLRQFFSDKLINPVTLTLFSQFSKPDDQPLAVKCSTCENAETIIRSIAEPFPLLKVDINDFVADHDKAIASNIKHIPCIIVNGLHKYGIRFFGVPTGYQLLPLVETIADASRGTTDLSIRAKSVLATITSQVSLTVFITTTCPYCTLAARMAHKMAIENLNICSSVYVIQDFPYLAQKYNVTSVPKIIINETTPIDGTVPDYELAKTIADVVKKQV